MRRAVVGIIRQGKRILIAKKKGFGELLSGKWHIPGGGIENDENDEEALIREMFEETNLKIKPIKYLGTHLTKTPTEVWWYECELVSGKAKAGSDISDIKWVNIDQVSNLCAKESVNLWPNEVKKYFGLID